MVKLRSLSTNRVLSSLWWLGFILLSQGTLLAADIRVTADRGQVALNETLQLIFTVQGEQSGEPDFSPLNKDFQLLGTSSSSQISMVNGSTSRSKSYTLRLVPKRAGELVIPSISFGKDRSNPGTMQVLEKAPAVPGGPDVGDSLRLVANVDVTEPYVQQQVLLTVKIYRRIKWQQAALSELDATDNDLLVQQLGEDKQYRTTLEGKNWEVIERKFAVFPQHSGELEINPFSLTVAVADDRKQKRSGFNDPFDRLFSRRSTVQKTVHSDSVKLQVKPAVTAVRPWLAAKDLKLQENWSVDTDKLKTGDSVTRTIAIIADGVSVGQLPQLKPVAVAGIKRYPDQPQTNEQPSSSGLLSTSSQKFALILSVAGEFEIPELEVSWWNVDTDRMETAQLPGRILKVSGPVAPVAEPMAPVQAEVATLPDRVSTESLPVPVSRTNSWLMLSNGVLVLLWLITLYAWWNAKKVSSQSAPGVTGSQSSPTRRELLKALDKAVTEKDGAAARDVILILARQIWPHNPPVSLAQMVGSTEGLLADELSNLDRSLYSADHANWDGSLILRQLSDLRPQQNQSTPRQGGLKLMYPAH